MGQVSRDGMVSARQLKLEVVVVVMVLLPVAVSVQAFVPARTHVFALAFQRAFPPAFQF